MGPGTVLWGRACRRWDPEGQHPGHLRMGMTERQAGRGQRILLVRATVVQYAGMVELAGGSMWLQPRTRGEWVSQAAEAGRAQFLS